MDEWTETGYMAAEKRLGQEILRKKLGYMSSKEWAEYHLAICGSMLKDAIKELPYDKNKWFTEKPGAYSETGEEQSS